MRFPLAEMGNIKEGAVQAGEAGTIRQPGRLRRRRWPVEPAEQERNPGGGQEDEVSQERSGTESQRKKALQGETLPCQRLPAG